MKAKCSCEGKFFPEAFRKNEVFKCHPELHETEYFCVKCTRHLGDECCSVDEDDPYWIDCPNTSKKLSGREYIDMFRKFHES